MRSKAFLSTPSARRATASGGLQKALKNISIHALREEGDCRHSGSGPAGAHFYPRPPRGGRPETAGLGVHRCYFYPRPPRGGRRKGRGACIDHILISIHALREEGDTESVDATVEAIKFLSTPSARRATSDPAARGAGLAISIHALREEGDPAAPVRDTRPENFYPRPPRGGRLASNVSLTHTVVFLSTPSARRATATAAASSAQTKISIHALREEGDTGEHLAGQLPEISIHALREEGDGCKAILVRQIDISIHALREEGDHFFASSKIPVGRFLSTPSARRATGGCALHGIANDISIHALREEGDGQGFRPPPNRVYFYPRPPRGGRLYFSSKIAFTSGFLSTPSARRATLGVCGTS